MGEWIEETRKSVFSSHWWPFDASLKRFKIKRGDLGEFGVDMTHCMTMTKRVFARSMLLVRLEKVHHTFQFIHDRVQHCILSTRKLPQVKILILRFSLPNKVECYRPFYSFLDVKLKKNHKTFKRTLIRTLKVAIFRNEQVFPW